MQLNAEGRQRFQAHLQKVLRTPCAVCGGGNWQIEDAIFELREFAGGGLNPAGAVKPVISMTCSNCGHLLFMSPLTTGIIQFQQQDPTEGSAENAATPESEG